MRFIKKKVNESYFTLDEMISQFQSLLQAFS